MAFTLPLVFFMIVAIIVVAKAIVVVPRGKVYVMSLLGKPAHVLSAGLHFVPAFVTTVAARIPIDEEQRAALEREQRVLAWLGERGESPGADGRPTMAQHAAYKAWSEQAVADHREEIEAAARAAADTGKFRSGGR